MLSISYVIEEWFLYSLLEEDLEFVLRKWKTSEKLLKATDVNDHPASYLQCNQVGSVALAMQVSKRS